MAAFKRYVIKAGKRYFTKNGELTKRLDDRVKLFVTKAEAKLISDNEVGEEAKPTFPAVQVVIEEIE